MKDTFICGAILLAGLTGCTSRPLNVPPITALACNEIAGQKSLSITLAFGLSRLGGKAITQKEWSSFLKENVTTHFPSALSILEAQGRWQETPTYPFIRERSRLIWIITPDNVKLASEIMAIRDAYKRRFNQSSVLAFINRGCAAF